MKQLQDLSLPESRGLYLPIMCKIVEAKELTELEKWYRIELPGVRDLGHTPGQFVEVSVLGVGEAPISVSSSPTQKGNFELCIRKVGMLTSVLRKMGAGDTIGIRGPFGHGFDVNAFKGKDVLIIGGGIGIVPLRSLINYILDRRAEFGRLIILYGTKSPAELLYREELAHWAALDDMEFHVTVDRAADDWKGDVGVITTLIPRLQLDLSNTVAAVTGPPVMYKFVLMALKSKRLPDEQIFVSLERRMKCGVGKCGHCQINGKYCCQDGPVFRYTDIKPLEEAL
ncbi:MAG: FAD/NAD(P)-binding protein [Candidatus Marinimicrobia bacterium]|nr:FAD/NAD(P)-binding protein [Candidatus Neomarinimicrobiota bacterium]MCF7840909.1 FAD/NAD(P)-binding protein [Candidatus Neomarinimicrobiota bacterium]MCF7902319.1 FAD/NAD(P)-binding protein [Candidatus Neomarinimicrobiota bacterium]